ncbi:signal peptidase II [Vulgatibacter sp.]|uniref:signal peptidase II n=1 Tax=Vulgatibacter sp. TaxID=1971226 RepID=UPI0035627827
MAARWRLLLSIFLLVLVIDQATKFWAVARLTRAFEMEQASSISEQVATFLGAEKLERLRTRPVVAQRDHLRFKYVENPGAAWGMLGGLDDRYRVPFFAVVSVFAITFMLLFFRRLPESQRLLQVALALVLGGAVGNFLDRLLRGYVIDFIDVHWKNDPRLHWPTFNVADIGISVGVALLLSQSLFGRNRSLVEEEPAEATPDAQPAGAPRPWIELDEAPAAAAHEDELFPVREEAAGPRPVAVNADGALVVDESAPERAAEEANGTRAAAGGLSEPRPVTHGQKE